MGLFTWSRLGDVVGGTLDDRSFTRRTPLRTFATLEILLLAPFLTPKKSRAPKMSAQYDPSDDTVADILKKDAKLGSYRYAQVGLQALLPKRYSQTHESA